jgi:hypothetical protein
MIEWQSEVTQPSSALKTEYAATRTKTIDNGRSLERAGFSDLPDRRELNLSGRKQTSANILISPSPILLITDGQSVFQPVCQVL